MLYGHTLGLTAADEPLNYYGYQKDKTSFYFELKNSNNIMHKNKKRKTVRFNTKRKKEGKSKRLAQAAKTSNKNK